MSTRLLLPHRRNHITLKVRIASQRTRYLSVHDDAQPAEIFLCAKGPDCSSELIGLYDVVPRLMSLALQYGAPLEQVGDLLAGARICSMWPCVWARSPQALFESARFDRPTSVGGVLRPRGVGPCARCSQSRSSASGMTGARSL